MAVICAIAMAKFLFHAYARKLPFRLPVMEHAHARQALPQWYSDQFGWNEIVGETAVAGISSVLVNGGIAESSPRTTGRPEPSTFWAGNMASPNR
jgi:hypothetical protein